MDRVSERLSADASSVGLARRLLRENLTRTKCDHLSGDAELLVTELVSNAVMHARTAVTLHVAVREGTVRVAVEDGSPQLPAWSPSEVAALSGRGLTLVNALADSWGAERLPSGGKTVWFELSGQRPDAEAMDSPEQLLAQWARLDEDNAEQLAGHGTPEDPVLKVVLNDVQPLELLAVRDHSDDLVRDCQLLLLDYESRSSGHVFDPRVVSVARRLDAAAEEFADAHAQLRAAPLRQLAGEHGHDKADLLLYLPRSSAAAAKRYADALDEAEGIAGAGLLLTQPSTDAQRRLRHWYLAEIGHQLRGARS